MAAYQGHGVGGAGSAIGEQNNQQNQIIPAGEFVVPHPRTTTTTTVHVVNAAAGAAGRSRLKLMK